MSEKSAKAVRRQERVRGKAIADAITRGGVAAVSKILARGFLGRFKWLLFGR
jgi:hypothetical protein